MATLAFAGTTSWLFENVQHVGPDAKEHVHCGCPQIAGTSRFTDALHPAPGVCEGIDAALDVVTISARINSLILAVTCDAVDDAVSPLEANAVFNDERQELLPLVPQ